VSDIAKFIAGQVDAYKKVRDVYIVFAEILRSILHQTVKDLGISAIVEGRAKELPSFAEKCIRKRDEYPDPVNMLTDLTGARVITEYTDQIEPVCAFIRKHFEIDEANSEDVLKRLGVSQFGYRAVHFIVSMKPDEFQKQIDALLQMKRRGAEKQRFMKAVARLCERRKNVVQTKTARLAPGPVFKAEIQVKTLLQHTWATLNHDRVYKGEIKPADALQRDLNRISAVLEDADAGFARVIHDVDGYQNYHGLYLPPDKRREEVKKLEAVLAFDKENARLARRAAHLANSVGDWEWAARVIERMARKWLRSAVGHRFQRACRDLKGRANEETVLQARRTVAKLQDPLMAGVLQEYGWAGWRLRKPGSRLLIEWSTLLDARNADARIMLGHAYARRSPTKALKCYEDAFRTKPSDPNVLSVFLHFAITTRGTLSFVPMLRSSLEEAIATCRRWADVNVCLPHAFYQMGYYSLLLDRPYESLTAYAKAVQVSDSESVVQEELDRIRDLRRIARRTLPEAEWVERFLLVSVVAKAWGLANDVSKALQKELGELEVARRALEDAHKRARSDDVAKAQTELAKAEKAVIDAEALAEAAVAKARKLRSEHLKGGVVTRGRPRYDAPIAIIAGGCRDTVWEKVKEYKLHIDTALRHFRGTVFSGGTQAGISGLVGSVPVSSKDSFKRVTYLRKGPHVQARVMEKTADGRGYEVHYMPGDDYTPLEPLQMWTDLLGSGVNPADVNLLGINGGRLTALEFRLALAMGATVGVIQNSGAAAKDILEDEDWKKADRLLLLPDDPQTAKAFVLGTPRAREINEEDQREISECDHKVHATERKAKRKEEPRNYDWDHLPPDFKNSTLQRTAYRMEQLAAIGMRIVKKNAVPHGVPPIRRFNKKQIEVMAEMEHGRWVVERLSEGWKWGKTRDEKEKTNPTLVPWADLPEDEKNKDRKYTREILGIKEFGYVVIPMGR